MRWNALIETRLKILIPDETVMKRNLKGVLSRGGEGRPDRELDAVMGEKWTLSWLLLSPVHVVMENEGPSFF